MDAVEQDLPTFTSSFERTIDEFLASGRWTIWVAELDRRMVGNAYVERVDKVPRPKKRPASWGYVTNVYVTPAHRNRGIGRRLLDNVIEAARADGWQLLILWPSELAVDFYGRIGFEVPEILELRLEGRPEHTPLSAVREGAVG